MDDIIPVREFWDLYSKNCIDVTKNENIPEGLYYSIFLDFLFGKLTVHKVSYFERATIHVNCENCKYIFSEREEVCEAHIGILKGLFEKRFGVIYNSEKLIKNKICHLKFQCGHDK